MKAEVIWALKCVQNNYSFQSNNGLNEIFRLMFPDSTIASGFSMAETKSKYLVQFGISRFVFEQLMEDIKGCPITFKFDETTTVQTKKQYDGFFQYDSKKFKKIVTHYAGSLFVGHCNKEQLKDHFFEFIAKLKIDVNLLLHISMDGPNVNKSFHKSLEQELLEKNGKRILNIGTCVLHPIHTGFSKGLSKLNFDFNKLSYDMHFFFKYSSARREDFKLCELETELEVKYTLKHVPSRWLSLKKVLIRIQEQWSNLKEYFLNFIPKQKNFTREIACTERYQFIKKRLLDDASLVYIGFAIFFAEILEKFLFKFQSKDPMIHILYNGIGDLFFELMNKFLKTENIIDKYGKRIEAKNLGKVDVSNNANQLSIHSIDYGTKVKSIIAKLESKCNIDHLKTEMKLSLIETTQYLQKMLPHDNTFLRDSQYLHPEKIRSQYSKSALSRIAVSIVNILKNTQALTTKTPEEYSDQIISELNIYKTEPIQSNNDVETFYNEMSKATDLQGKPKFTNLSSLAKICLCVSHGNADPERGFSLNKAILDGRESLKDDTIIALRIVKDHLILHERIENFKISQRLLYFASKARQEYQNHQEMERKKSIEHAARKRQAEENEKTSKKRKESVNEINQLINEETFKLKAAEDLIVKGNSMLEAAIANNNISKQKVQEAKALIDMGLKTSKSIKDTLDTLNKKKENMTN